MTTKNTESNDPTDDGGFKFSGDRESENEHPNEGFRGVISGVSDRLRSRRNFMGKVAMIGTGTAAVSTSLGTVLAQENDDNGNGKAKSGGNGKAKMGDSDDDETGNNGDANGGGSGEGSGTEIHLFHVRIENVSTMETLQTSKGPKPAPHTPGAFAVHTQPGPIFSPGEPARGNGLEEIAEAGRPNPYKLASSLAARSIENGGGVPARDGAYGVFDIPVSGTVPAPALPGQAYEFNVRARQSERLSFVSMFGMSNDLFYAPDDMGIKLFESGEPVSGDVTDQITLWDAGTEQNQEPGMGDAQAPRQPREQFADFGTEENEPVRPISEVDDGFTYPPDEDVISVTITPQ